VRYSGAFNFNFNFNSCDRGDARAGFRQLLAVASPSLALAERCLALWPRWTASARPVEAWRSELALPEAGAEGGARNAARWPVARPRRAALCVCAAA
jgi:hypothetical protein